MIPTAWVSPVGSLSTGRFCGPIKYPVAVVKDLPAPPSGVAMIGAPSTITATQDPVGTIRSRRYPIPPRANHTDSTNQARSPSGSRDTKVEGTPSIVALPDHLRPRPILSKVGREGPCHDDAHERHPAEVRDD